MTAEHTANVVPESAESLSDKPTASPRNPSEEQSPEFDKQDLDSRPNPSSPRVNGKSTASGVEPEDPHALHSMANAGHEEELDQKTESPVPSSEGKYESAPPTPELKSEPSPSAERDEAIPEQQGPKTGKTDSSSEPPLADDVSKVESSSPQDGTEKSVTAGQTEETTPEKARNIDEGTEPPVTAGKAEEVPAAKQQPSISSAIEAAAVSANEERAPVPDQAAEVAPGETTPDQVLENPDLLTELPPVKSSFFDNFPRKQIKSADLKVKVVIPPYLSKGMVGAIESAGVAYSDAPRVDDIKAPEYPILVFINSKSGGRLGPQLEALLVELIAPTQVYDLSRCKPAEVLRDGLGYLEKEADAGDNTALETRNNLRIMVAGGDGTVGWVLGSIAGLGVKERFKTPPVGVIPLGTGNDLSRSFRWGGSTTSVSRRAVKKWLLKATEADVATLDSWQVVVKPAPSRQDTPLKLPHALLPQHHIPLEDAGSEKAESKSTPFFVGSFWNYFSLGMDAQVAYGFHHLRNEAPWLASGRISNQMVYGGYSCLQGWFCTPCTTAPVLRGLKQIAKVSIKRNHDVDTQWEELVLPSNIRAIVVLNLQSYAGGRNPWGRPGGRQREKSGLLEAQCNDGVLEIVGFRDGWHTAFVLLDFFTAVRLGQARAVKLELNGKARRAEAYMQMDGEPWQQPLGHESHPPAVVEITRNPVHSICLLRK